MKRTFLILLCMFNVSSAATQLSVEDGQTLSETYRYMSQIPLPDGMSVFGNPCPGSKSFDFEHLNDRGGLCFYAALELSKLLRTSETPIKTREQRLEAIRKSYDFLIAGLYNLTPDAIGVFEEILANSTVYQTPISVPKQPERAAYYNKLAHWRVFKDSRPDDALEAIRLERERLDAIAAEEEAKRKAEADEEVARVAAIAAAESARAEAAKKTQDATSTLRHRKGHGTTVTPGSDTDDRRAVEKDPLLPKTY
jgi:hypothetical protein